MKPQPVPVPRGLLRGGTSPRAAASPPPRSRAGALTVAWGGKPPPAAPLCPARGTARLQAQPLPCRAVPAGPPRRSAPLRSQHRQQGLSRPVPTRVSSSPSPTAASKATRGLPQPGPALGAASAAPLDPGTGREGKGRDGKGRGWGSTRTPDAFRSHGDRELRGFRQGLTHITPVMFNFPVSSAAKHHGL